MSGRVRSGPCLNSTKRTRTDFVGDPGLRPGSREKVRACPRGSGRARVVDFSLNDTLLFCQV